MKRARFDLERDQSAEYLIVCLSARHLAAKGELIARWSMSPIEGVWPLSALYG